MVNSRYVPAIDLSQLARVECQIGAEAVGGAHKKREAVTRPAIKSAYARCESTLGCHEPQATPSSGPKARVKRL